MGAGSAAAAGRCPINRRLWHSAGRHRACVGLALLALALLAAACSGAGSAPATPRPPTPIPPTPTPRSTALPPLDRPIALLGGQERPLTIAFALPGGRGPSASDRAALAQAVADALQPLSQTLNLADDIEVQAVTLDEPAALRALCSGAPVTAWVSAFTYAAAARACGAQPMLALIREGDAGTTIGAVYEVVVPADVTRPADLAGQVACRVEGDLDAWAVSALMLQAEGFNALAQMSHSAVYPGESAAFDALMAGECAALALPAGRLEALLDPLPVRDENPRERLHVLVGGGDPTLPDEENTSLSFPRYAIPYGLWVAAPESALPAGELRPLREELEAAVAAHLDDNPAALARWFDASGAVPVDAGGLAGLRRWLDDAGWDMAFRP